MLIDSHAHLNFADYAENLDKVIAEARTAGVEKIINIGASLNDSREAVEIAQKYDGLFATVGIHPNDNPQATVENVDWATFEVLVQKSKVVAIGETGLDYSRLADLKGDREQEERKRQAKLFTKQIDLALKHSLPISIHVREAQKDLMEIFQTRYDEVIFRRLGDPYFRGVFHCFSGDENYLNFVLKQLPDFYVSFAGNLTFKSAGQLRESAKLVPLGRLLVETDCPFLSPEPYRGMQNVPARVKYVAEELAEIKQVPFEEISAVTTKNAEKLFRIRPAA